MSAAGRQIWAAAAGGRRVGNDMHAAAVLVELHVAGLQRVQGPVAADADVVPGVELGTALADDDGAGVDQLTAEALHAETFSVAVAVRCGHFLDLLLMCQLAPFRKV
jgi:hypothetical protein